MKTLEKGNKGKGGEVIDKDNNGGLGPRSFLICCYDLRQQSP